MRRLLANLFFRWLSRGHKRQDDLSAEQAASMAENGWWLQ